ncbi:MAG TPA: hypothetical protein PK624_07640 [Spirochaetota bacterium]|nr:hypothetical protein [Spirochaetota bacterium]HOR44652.1 hypothetical protein [Spirochaetota bacterium]HPK56101.1 hypothetical protein [Spirochaetota bacterium]
MKKFLAAVISASSICLFAESADVNYSKAQMLRSENKFSEAVELLLKIDNHPEQYRIYHQIAEIYLQLKDFAKAEEYAKKSIELKDDFAEAYIVLYNSQNSLQKTEDSADTLYTLTLMNPKNPEFLYILGSIHYNQLNNIIMAKYCFDLLLNLSYEQSIPAQYMERIHIVLSEINYELGNYNEAIENIKSAMEYNAQNSERMLKIAGFLAGLNQLKSSARAYESVFNSMTPEQKKDPLAYKISAFIGTIHYLNGDARASAYLKYSLGDKTSSNKLARALLYAIAGNDKAAMPLINELLTTEDAHLPAVLAGAKVSETAGDKESAAAFYSRAGELINQTDLHLPSAKINRKAAEFNNSAAHYRYAASSFEKAKLTANAILMIEKSNSAEFNIENYLYTGYLYSVIKNRSKFENIINNAKKLEPKNPRVYYISALSNFDVKNYQGSLTDISKAIELSPEDPYIRFHAAITYEKLSKTADAAREMQEALKYDKENPGYLNFLGYIYVDSNINLDKAESMIQSALSKEPNNGAFLDSLGWLHYRKKNYNEAFKYLYRGMQNLTAAKTEDPVVYDHLGDTSLKLGKKQKAIEYWIKALSFKADPKIEAKVKNAVKN